MRRLLPGSLVLLASLSFAQTPAATQVPATKTDSGTTTFRSESRLVSIDVIATDKSGKLVTDLAAKDFEVTQDRKPQTLRLFDRVTKTTYPAGPDRSQLKLAPDVVTNVPERASRKPLNILFIDLLNQSFESRKRSREAAVQAVKAMAPDQAYSVYVLGRELKLVLDVTTDRNKMELAVKTDRSANTIGNATVLNSGESPAMLPADVGQAPLIADNNTDVSVMLEAIDNSYAELEAEVRCITLHRSLRALANRLSGIPGRKKLIWMADVFPFNPVTDATTCSTDTVRTAELFTLAQIAIYPINIGGLDSPGAKASERNSAAMPAAQWAMGRFLNGTRADLDNVAQMRMIADVTGGKAYANSNNIVESVKDSFEDGTQYYTLGFYLSKEDQSNPYHNLRVKVLRPGVQTRYRSTYVLRDYAKLDAKQRSQDFGLALDPNTPITSELMFIAEPKPRDMGIDVRFAVDAQKLRFEMDQTGKLSAKVDFVAEVYDENQKLVKREYKTVESALGDDGIKKVMATGFPGELRVAVLPGQYSLRLGVRDSRTGALGTANASVTVQ